MNLMPFSLVNPV